MAISLPVQHIEQYLPTQQSEQRPHSPWLPWLDEVSLYIENVVTLEFEHHRVSAASPTFDHTESFTGGTFVSA